MERLLFGVNAEEVTSFTIGVINQQLQFKSKVAIVILIVCLFVCPLPGLPRALHAKIVCVSVCPPVCHSSTRVDSDFRS